MPLFHPLQHHLCKWPRVMVGTGEAGIHPGQIRSPSQDTHSLSHSKLGGIFIEENRKPTRTTNIQTVEETPIQTLPITVEELLNPIILLFGRLLLPSYASLRDPDDSTCCVTVKIIFAWQLKTWIRRCRFALTFGLWLCVCVCGELIICRNVCLLCLQPCLCNNI